MIILTLFFVIPFERTDLCDIICSQLHINNFIEFGKSLTLSSWRCFLVWLVDRVVHLLSSWGWIATRDYSDYMGREWKKSIPKIRELEGNESPPVLDKAPRLSISIVIWILSSDTICQLNQFNTNSEAAMLSKLKQSWSDFNIYVGYG